MSSPVSHNWTAVEIGPELADRTKRGKLKRKKTKTKKGKKKRLFYGAEMTTNSPEVYLKRERARRCRAPERRRISPLTSRLNVKSTAQHFDVARCHLPFYYRERCSIKGCISFIMIQKSNNYYPHRRCRRLCPVFWQNLLQFGSAVAAAAPGILKTPRGRQPITAGSSHLTTPQVRPI